MQEYTLNSIIGCQIKQLKERQIEKDVESVTIAITPVLEL